VSARPTRVATAGSLAVALALALPAAAFAEDEREPSGRAADRSAEQGGERGRSETAPHGSTGGTAEPAAKDRQRGRSEERAAGEDPPGNNGTVKIDGEPFDDGRGNEPHVGCTFAVDFYGFDAGDTATITFTGHAPTGGGLLHTESRTISTDAAGGGQDHDATITYSVDDQLSELRSIEPHAQQGWHVRRSVDVDNAPGGAKQKVFWIDCPNPVTSTTTFGGGATADTTTDTTPLGGGNTDAATVLPATVVSGTTVAAAERQDALTLGAGTATLAATGTPAGDVSAQGAVQPTALPFTGSTALLSLLALGLSAVGAGALAHRMGRRTVEG
jgi:hypothetical protein